jgi:hypothetical protein
VPATCLYPEPDQSSPCPIPLYEDPFYPSTPGSSKWSLSFRTPHHLYAPLLSTIRATCPVHLILNNLFHRAKWIPFNMIQPVPLNSFLKHFFYEDQYLRVYILSYGDVSWLRGCVARYSFV